MKMIMLILLSVYLINNLDASSNGVNNLESKSKTDLFSVDKRGRGGLFRRGRGGRAHGGRRGDDGRARRGSRGGHDVVVIPVYGTGGHDTSGGGTGIQGAPPINETGGSNTTQARGGGRNDHNRDKASLVGFAICLFLLFMSLAVALHSFCCLKE